MSGLQPLMGGVGAEATELGEQPADAAEVTHRNAVTGACELAVECGHASGFEGIDGAFDALALCKLSDGGDEAIEEIAVLLVELLVNRGNRPSRT